MAAVAITTPTTNAVIPVKPGGASAEPAKSGSLRVAILSAYDLPRQDAPAHVAMSIETADGVAFLESKSGPPAQRHKDRNAFKFADDIGAAGGLVLNAALQDLFSGYLVLSVVYSDSKDKASLYKAEYALDQLKVGETTWLVLTLEKEGAPPLAAGVEPPTLRLHLTLDGPYRVEFGAIVSLFSAWFKVVDSVMGGSGRVWDSVPHFNPLYLGLAVLPIVFGLLLASPLLIGGFVITLPITIPLTFVSALPVGTVFLCTVIGIATFALVWICSTGNGRQRLASILNPVKNTMLSHKMGQRLVYQTGPRPNPVELAALVVPSEHSPHNVWHKLMVAVVIDFIGVLSYIPPFIGEFADVVWAPLSTLLVMAMYSEKHTPGALPYIAFIEEALPFTDFVPTATIGWFAEYGLPMIQGKDIIMDPTGRKKADEEKPAQVAAEIK